MKRVLAAVAVLFLASASYAQTFTIDPNHSSVTFTVRHLVGRVAGHFNKFEGTFDYDKTDYKTWKAMATVDTASVDTGNEKRDGHLQTPDFFDSKTYPTMTFKSTGISDVKGETAKLHGNLTLHGVTQPVVLDLEIGGTVNNPMGPGVRAGAVATGKINRKDFGMTNKMDASGMIGEDVAITINIEGVSK